MSIYPWQSAQWLQVKKMAQHQFPHALLLSGCAGLGKQAFAEHLARWLLCDVAKEQQLDAPCGECPACHLLAAGNHSDYIEVLREEKSKVIKVDQVRALIDALSQTSMRDGMQVVMMYPADCMHTAAANALLKTLEEPPGNVVFILVCDYLYRLPATVLSRCQRLDFNTDESLESLPWLEQQVKDSGGCEEALRLANHAPLLAQTFLTSGYVSLRDTIYAGLLSILKREQDPVALAKDCEKSEVDWVFRIILTLSMDMIRLRLGASLTHIMHQSLGSSLHDLANKVDPVQLLRFYQDVQQQHQMIIGGLQPNVLLLLEALFISCCDLLSGAKSMKGAV